MERVAKSGSPSSIDADRLTRNESGLVRGEKGDHRGDLVGTAEAADRDRLGALGEANFEIVAIFAPVGAASDLVKPTIAALEAA